MSQMNVNMNFLPEDYVEKRKATRAAIVFIGLLVIVVGGILGTYVWKQMQSKDVFDEQTAVNAQYEEASRQITVAQDLEKEKARMMAKAELTTTLMERVRRSSLLEEFTKLCPKGVKMQSLELSTKDVSGSQKPSDLERARRQQAGLPPDGPAQQLKEVQIDLVGTAPTDKQVADYIAALSKSDLLTDVNLVFSEEFLKEKNNENSEKIRRFRVQMKVNPSADLRGLDGSAAAPVASGEK